MPRLGNFLVCEKLITDQQGKPSLISLFQKMGAFIPEGQAIPKEVLAMTPLSTFCEWFFTDDELTRTFVQHLEVLLPDGTPSPVRASLPLKDMTRNGQGTRAFVNIVGMPVAQAGFITVNVWLEENSERVTEVYPYRIQIEHTSQQPTPKDGGTVVHAVVPGQRPN